jgi:hypothetical protein
MIYGKVIVLEDDLVTSKYFLRYMNDALNIYKNERKEFGKLVVMFILYLINIEKIFFSLHIPPHGVGLLGVTDGNTLREIPKKLIDLVR